MNKRRRINGRMNKNMKEADIEEHPQMTHGQVKRETDTNSIKDIGEMVIREDQGLKNRR